MKPAACSVSAFATPAAQLAPGIEVPYRLLAGARAEGPAPGLVKESTSDTNLGRPSQELRLNRLRRRVHAVAKIAHNSHRSGGFRRWAVFVTTTLRPDEHWEPRDISKLTKCIRSWAARQGFEVPYVWVMELTEKGRPHFHLIAWLPHGRVLPKPDEAGWWTKGSTRIELARKPINYLCKYTSKGVLHDTYSILPKGARMHGSGGLPKDERAAIRWRMMPAWVREKIGFQLAKPAQGGGWLVLDTGEVLTSPYVVIFDHGFLRFLTKSEAYTC